MILSLFTSEGSVIEPVMCSTYVVSSVIANVPFVVMMLSPYLLAIRKVQNVPSLFRIFHTGRCTMRSLPFFSVIFCFCCHIPAKRSGMFCAVRQAIELIAVMVRSKKKRFIIKCYLRFMIRLPVSQRYDIADKKTNLMQEKIPETWFPQGWGCRRCRWMNRVRVVSDFNVFNLLLHFNVLKYRFEVMTLKKSLLKF